MAALSHTITLRFDGGSVASLLAQLAKAPPETRDAFFSALDAGENLFVLNCDDRLTRRTGEMIVRLELSDCLVGLLFATGASD